MLPAARRSSADRLPSFTPTSSRSWGAPSAPLAWMRLAVPWASFRSMSFSDTGCHWASSSALPCRPPVSGWPATRLSTRSSPTVAFWPGDIRRPSTDQSAPSIPSRQAGSTGSVAGSHCARSSRRAVPRRFRSQGALTAAWPLAVSSVSPSATRPSFSFSQRGSSVPASFTCASAASFFRSAGNRVRICSARCDRSTRNCWPSTFTCPPRAVRGRPCQSGARSSPVSFRSLFRRGSVVPGMAID